MTITMGNGVRHIHLPKKHRISLSIIEGKALRFTFTISPKESPYLAEWAQEQLSANRFITGVTLE